MNDGQELPRAVHREWICPDCGGPVYLGRSWSAGTETWTFNCQDCSFWTGDPDGDARIAELEECDCTPDETCSAHHRREMKALLGRPDVQQALRRSSQ